LFIVQFDLFIIQNALLIITKNALFIMTFGNTLFIIYNAKLFSQKMLCLKNKTSVPVFYCRIKYRYIISLGAYELKHKCFNYTDPNEYRYFILR